MIGSVVGKYRLLAQIGEGGMGTVFRAEHTVLGGPAAVKVLLPQWTKDAIVVDRFFHEAKAATAIRHVGIVEVFDFGRLANDRAWIAMELLRGETLGQFFVRNEGKVDPAVAVQVGMQLLAALDAAHLAGVVHRDLKPDNVFLVRDPGAPGAMRVKILDFGIAKLGADRFGAKQKTQGGTILGTPSYMAPEQCKAESNIDARADLYALGCILFELLTGRAPFDAEAGAEIMAMHILEPAPRLSTYAPQLPAELDALIAKLLVKTPADRTPSAAYAHAALERVPMPPIAGYVELFDASGARAGTYTPPVADAPEPRTSKWFPIVILLVALAIAGAAIYFIGLRGDELGK